MTTTKAHFLAAVPKSESAWCFIWSSSPDVTLCGRQIATVARSAMISPPLPPHPKAETCPRCRMLAVRVLGGVEKGIL